jgi:flagellar basal-body rod modification protein FlgD
MTIPSSLAGSLTQSTVAAENPGKQVLDADDFMKLLTTQLTSQDPMNPMKDTEFISQMANFTSLEQMRSLSKSFETFTTDQRMAAAPAYLGRQVTIKDAAAGEITGTVEAITLRDGKPNVVINGKPYETHLITGITTPPPPVDPAALAAATTPATDLTTPQS